MANVFKNSALVSKVLAVAVENNLVMGRLVKKQFVNTFVNEKTGGTVSYQKPVKFTVGTGADITGNIQDITETTGNIQVNLRHNVPFQIPSQDLALSVEKISEKYLIPAAIQLANKVDDTLCGLFTDVYNTAGVAGTAPSSFADVGAAGKVLTRFSVPNRGRRLVVDEEAEYDIPAGLSSILEQNIVKDIIKEANVGRVAKFDIFGDQNVRKHVAGDWTGAIKIAGAGQTGKSINVDSFTNSGAAQLKKGDIVTFAGSNSVNPVSRQDTGKLKEHVLTADATVSAGAPNTATILIEPGITLTGAYQTVTASPGDNAVVTALASHTANLAFHEDAFQLVTVPITVPEDALGGFQDHKGVGIRWIKWYDGFKDIQTYRMDILFGVVTQYPEFACRLLG